MMKRLMNAPINLYFDKTTTGKILGLFESELNVVTRNLPQSFTSTFQQICKTLYTICLISYYSPICLLVVPVIIISFLVIMRNFIALKRQIEILYKLVGAPSHTHINESIQGTTTIRTFNKTKMFQSKFCEIKDRDYSIEILNESLGCWLTVRMNLL